MLLTVDIGNTVVTLGVFDGDRLVTTLRVATDTRRLVDEYGATLSNLLEATVKELGWLVHSHPTLSEAVKEAALAAEGRAIHI